LGRYFLKLHLKISRVSKSIPYAPYYLGSYPNPSPKISMETEVTPHPTLFLSTSMFFISGKATSDNLTYRNIDITTLFI